jgi:hypothetical protein
VARWRSGGARALETARLLARERFRPDAQQLVGLRAQDHQRGGLDPDDDGPSAEDLGGEHLPIAAAHQAAVVDRAIDLDRRSILGLRQRGGPAARRRAGRARSGRRWTGASAGSGRAPR